VIDYNRPIFNPVDSNNKASVRDPNSDAIVDACGSDLLLFHYLTRRHPRKSHLVLSFFCLRLDFPNYIHYRKVNKFHKDIETNIEATLRP
jgi:hypothetical protein